MNIEVQIKNKNDIISSYNDKMLCEEFHNYILNNCKLHKISDITLNINSNLSELELKEVTNLIHNYYQDLSIKAKKLDCYDDYLRLIIFFLGILFIILSHFFKMFFSEVLLIIGWVLIWEIIYDIFFSQIRRKRNAKIYEKLATSKIIFKEKN